MLEYLYKEISREEEGGLDAIVSGASTVESSGSISSVWIQP